ncbi:di-heme oxidoredictase family protein [Flavobacterium luminosum]|uniref:Thiol oxidoreductase n=1 Tax=Flavobacterium luminosum TaxID=2949086 RepID=A0ABT0TQQ1_9FLAO|nr:di-heme oxidoredictase family protein [Flavobacterium sp. HXWNR70]MCL9809823.1 thiol oxidoreductase [Flavobacterium sp. HXWNR70]
MKNNICLILIIIGLSLFMTTSCEDILTQEPEMEDILDGPIDGLSSSESLEFLEGDVAFNEQVFTAETGLGPLFVATSCVSCHAGDGKGHPFTTLTRFGQSDVSGNQFMHLGAPQLQNRALPGYLPEQIPSGASSAKFMPPANTGLGFLAALTDAQILAIADPFDSNNDGISGVPNYITPPSFFSPKWFHQENNGKYIGRFGKKAAAIDLLHQTVNAYNQDMGITSSFSPRDTYSGLDIDPEVSNRTVNNVVFYLRTLKAPLRRNQNDAEVQAGEALFSNLKCAECHKPQWTTPNSDIAGLANKTFYPYTDLLLHDMESGLDDGYTEGQAQTSEWRTPPLWGIGLAKKSQGGQYFLLHDGRARSIEQAILMHGGEALNSKNSYQQLTTGEKQKLVKFIESL